MKTHLVFALLTVALLAFVITRSGERPLTFDTVVEIARTIGREDFVPQKELPEALRTLDYDQQRSIRFREDATLWRQEGLPFQLRFFFTNGGHRAVSFFRINQAGAGPLPFSPTLFDFDPLAKLDRAQQASGDFSGFRLYYPIDRDDRLDEVVAFQGASYFRPRAKNQIYGASARGLAIDTLGEERFPAFTAFWFAEPSANATEFTFYALLDGADVTGAYEFRVKPGAETKIHVRARLFPRREIKDVGLAPLTSMFWYGENTSNTFGGWRPEVHDSDGLQILRSNGEWIWRPLAWAKQRQVNTYADTNPPGFGLFQRDHDFTHYQDLEANYHMRPSIWVQPEGEWGEGEVVLMQNPTANEFEDNVVAYWRPKAPLTSPTEIAYTLTTFTSNEGLPPIGRCISTRIDYQERADYRFFVVDFAGGPLENLGDDAKVSANVWAGGDGILSDVQTRHIPDTNTWRLSFGVTSRAKHQPVELRCSLALDGKPVTETWSSTWVK